MTAAVEKHKLTSQQRIFIYEAKNQIQVAKEQEVGVDLNKTHDYEL